MTDADADASDEDHPAADADGDTDPDAAPPSTREYLSLVFRNRISQLGIAVALAGFVGLRLFGTSRQRALLGTGVMLAGVGLFVVGFTLAQHRLRREGEWGH